ncbi:MAG: hypothetical protein ACUVS6_07445 [Anaerolineae bacterium]
MLEHAVVIFGLAFLVPIGYALIVVGGLEPDRARRAALSFCAAFGLAAVGYVVSGFALQFGGIGLVYDRPGFEGLIWEWSALGPTWGPGWGMAGLAGWGLVGAAATPAARSLALTNLPWAVTAAQIPLIALRGRVPMWAAGLLGLFTGGLFYPLAGNWIAGGGWLANLGANLGLGHGLVDAGGAAAVHLLGAAMTLAGLIAFAARRPRTADPQLAVPLPPLHFPLYALVGAGLLLAGTTAWFSAVLLPDRGAPDLAAVLLNMVLAAAGGTVLSLGYTWLVAGRPDPLMALRGLATAVTAGLACAPFVPPWAALAVGLVSGFLVPLAIFSVDHLLRFDDPVAALTVHGLGAVLGLLALGLLADGSAGVGWNGVGAEEYLGVAGQGVTGLLATGGFRPDWPGQMQAQLIGVAAIALFGFFAAWLCLMPLAMAAYLLRQPLSAQVASAQAVPQETMSVALDLTPEATAETVPVEG